MVDCAVLGCHWYTRILNFLENLETKNFRDVKFYTGYLLFCYKHKLKLNKFSGNYEDNNKEIETSEILVGILSWKYGTKSFFQYFYI